MRALAGKTGFPAGVIFCRSPDNRGMDQRQWSGTDGVRDASELPCIRRRQTERSPSTPTSDGRLPSCSWPKPAPRARTNPSEVRCSRLAPADRSFRSAVTRFPAPMGTHHRPGRIRFDRRDVLAYAGRWREHGRAGGDDRHRSDADAGDPSGRPQPIAVIAPASSSAAAGGPPRPLRHQRHQPGPLTSRPHPSSLRSPAI